MALLGLRFNAAETSSSAPDIAAFVGLDRRLLAEQLADHDDRSPLADLVAAGLAASCLRVLIDEPHAGSPVFVTLRATPIPAITSADPAVDPRAFLLADQVHGHFAWPARAGRSRGGAALVLAACIPLVVPDVARAQAAGARSTGTATTSTSAPAATTAPAPVVTPTPPAPVVTTPPQPDPAAPAIAPGVTDSDAAIKFETILRAMNGREGVVFAGGTKVRGLIVGVDGDFVTVIDADRGGKIALIPKTQITEVRGKLKPKLPVGMPNGIGGIVSGSVLVGVGSPLMLSGLVFLSFGASYYYVYLPQILSAAVMLGVGIPVLVRGTKRRRAYKAAMQEAELGYRLSPSVGRTRGGAWTGGLSFRF